MFAATDSTVIIGQRHRVISHDLASGTCSISCDWMMRNQSTARKILDRAKSIIFLGYVRDATGQIDGNRSLELAGFVRDVFQVRMSRVLYLSTDAVFGGAGAGPYSDSARPCPTTSYGEMKLAQERALQGACILRFTVLGPSFSGRPMLAEMVRTQLVHKLYPNAYFSPVSTYTLNRVIERFLAGELASGIHHLASERVSKARVVADLAHAMGVCLPCTFVDESDTLDVSLAPSPGLAFSLQDEIQASAARLHAH